MVKTIGDEIKLKRFQNGLSQIQLAALLGVTNKLLKAFERDTRTPNEHQLCKLADLLKLNLAFINRSRNS